MDANKQLIEGRILGENDDDDDDVTDDTDEGMEDSGKDANASTSTHGSKANMADKIATTTNTEYGADFAIVLGLATARKEVPSGSLAGISI